MDEVYPKLNSMVKDCVLTAIDPKVRKVNAVELTNQFTLKIAVFLIDHAILSVASDTQEHYDIRKVAWERMFPDVSLPEGWE